MADIRKHRTVTDKTRPVPPSAAEEEQLMPNEPRMVEAQRIDGHQQSQQQEQPRSSSLSSTHPPAPSPYPVSQHAPNTGSSAQQIQSSSPSSNVQAASKGSEDGKPSFNVPSVYLVSPLSTIVAQLGYVQATDSNSPNAMPSVVSSNISPADQTPRPTTPPIAALPRRKLLSLLQFFRAKILVNVHFIFEEELEDLDDLVDSRSELATCMAYVGALFAPGQSILRKHLSLQLLSIVRRGHYAAGLDEKDTWTILQALSLLYLFALPIDGTASQEDSPYRAELSYRALKSLVESLALHTSIHRSHEDVVKGTLDRDTNVGKSPPLKRYLFWLWLFTASQQYALITRTPPTISEDSTIRSAPVVLQTLRHNILVRRVLSQVDLYLLWGQIGHRYPNVREWWSTPYADLDMSSTKVMLRDFDARLEEWKQRWTLNEAPEMLRKTTPGLHEDASIEFAFRYTKFHISTYITKALYKAVSDNVQANGQSSDLVALTPPLMELFVQSIEAATRFSRFYTDIDPLISETARYVSAMAFAKVAFSCIYIVMASEVLAGPDLKLEQHLGNVREVAIGMSELAVDRSSPPRLYADRILQRMQASSGSRGLKAIRIVPSGSHAADDSSDMADMAVATDAAAPVSRLAWNQTMTNDAPLGSAGPYDRAGTQATDYTADTHHAICGDLNSLSPAGAPNVDFADFNFMMSLETEHFFELDNDWAL